MGRKFRCKLVAESCAATVTGRPVMDGTASSLHRGESPLNFSPLGAIVFFFFWDRARQIITHSTRALGCTFGTFGMLFTSLTSTFFFIFIYVLLWLHLLFITEIKNKTNLFCFLLHEIRYFIQLEHH